MIAFAPSAPLNPTVPVRVELTEGGLQDDWGNRIATLSQAVTWGQGTLYSTGAAPGSTRTFPVARGTVGNHVLFQAHLYDEDIGIYLMRARVYDPRTGQFLQRDPIPFVDGINVYAGMANDPINYRDPTGALAPAAILGACLVGGAFNVGIEAIKNWVSDKEMTGKQVLDAAAVGCVSSVAGLAGGWLLGAGAKALGYGKFAAGATGALGGGAAAGSTMRALMGEDINLQTIAFDAALGGLGWGVGNGLGAIGRGVGSALRKPTGCAGGACLLKGRPCKCFTEDTEVWTPAV